MFNLLCFDHPQTTHTKINYYNYNNTINMIIEPSLCLLHNTRRVKSIVYMWYMFIIYIYYAFIFLILAKLNKQLLFSQPLIKDKNIQKSSINIIKNLILLLFVFFSFHYFHSLPFFSKQTTSHSFQSFQHFLFLHSHLSPHPPHSFIATTKDHKK